MSGLEKSDRNTNGSAANQKSVVIESSGDMDPRHALGYAGEQSAGFHFGRLGYHAITGPSGSEGHKITAHGFDGVMYDPQSNHLIIYDNKSSSLVRNNVSGASAIDPTKNLIKNLNASIEKVKGMPKGQMPAGEQSRAIQLMEQFRDNPHNPPSNVTIAVTNAHGSGIGGITDRLKALGTVFIPFDKIFSSASELKTWCHEQAKKGAASAKGVLERRMNLRVNPPGKEKAAPATDKPASQNQTGTRLSPKAASPTQSAAGKSAPASQGCSHNQTAALQSFSPTLTGGAGCFPGLSTGRLR